jgi:NADH:ubiquinone oxidoreductase subunit H
MFCQNPNTRGSYFDLRRTTAACLVVKRQHDKMDVLKFVIWDFFFCPFYSMNDCIFATLDLLMVNSYIKLGLTALYLQTILIKNSALLFTVKILISTLFLVLIRGGTPRYRYDYLTKLGWLKFLGLLVVFFLTTLIIYFLF